MKEWKTVSSKVSAEVYNAMQMLCQRDPQMNMNKIIKRAIEKEVAPILNKDSLSSEAFPNLGVNNFEYDPEADNFMWTVNAGNNSAIISSKLSTSFVENISKSTKEGLDKRSKILRKVKKNQTYIPKSIIKFKEK